MNAFFFFFKVLRLLTSQFSLDSSWPFSLVHGIFMYTIDFDFDIIKIIHPLGFLPLAF